MKIDPPSGFFRALIEVMSQRSALVFGVVLLLIGVLLKRMPELHWSVATSDLSLALGVTCLMSVYLVRLIDGTSNRVSILGALVAILGLSLAFVVHQAYQVKGVVNLGDKPIETLSTRMEGADVSFHLGGPLKLSKDTDGDSLLVYGLAQQMTAKAPNDRQHARLSSWFLDNLGFNFEGAELTALVSIEAEQGKWTSAQFNEGSVVQIDESVNLRLRSIQGMPSGQGNRLVFEIFKGEERLNRVVYEGLPTLDEQINADLPRLRVEAVTRGPSRRMFIYKASSVSMSSWILFGGALLILGTFLRRQR